jgi:nitrile hydratase accessory protein
MTTPVRPDATEVGDARRRVESLVCGLPGGSDAERSFEQPWELRAFAIAVAAHHNRQYEWSEFQLSLIESIKRWETDRPSDGSEPWSYYEHWLTALETVLAGNGLLSDASLDDATRAVLSTPRNANHQEAHREPVAIDPAIC